MKTHVYFVSFLKNMSIGMGPNWDPGWMVVEMDRKVESETDVRELEDETSDQLFPSKGKDVVLVNFQLLREVDSTQK